MADGPADAVGQGVAGCGCLAAILIFFGALFSGAGIGGALGAAFVLLLLAAWAVGTLS